MNSFNIISYIMFCVHTTYVLIENTENIILGGFILYDDKLTKIRNRSFGPEDFELTRFNPLLHMLFLDHDFIFYF